MAKAKSKSQNTYRGEVVGIIREGICSRCGQFRLVKVGRGKGKKLCHRCGRWG